MTPETNQQDLAERLSVIENMLAEGRRTTENWGWTFVLWGVAYYVAMAWATWGQSHWAWPVTMVAAAAITAIVASMKTSHSPETTLGRAVGSIWMALGISMFLLFLALGISGKLTDVQIFVAVASGMLGMANATSALVLRWKVQFACAVVWWAAAVAACFGTQMQSVIVFLVAIFFCQIVFGIYGMLRGGRATTRSGAIHA